MTEVGGRIIPPHFSPGAVRFSIRTTIASSAALLVAWSLGLSSPHWAAMTVWLVSQPTRGMVLSKGFYRIFGTGLGALASFGIVLLAEIPIAFSLALASWVGVCAVMANLLRGFRSYAAVLSGVTGAMLSLLAVVLSESDLALAFSRLGGVLVGIVVVGVVAALFISRADEREIVTRAEKVAGEALALTDAMIAQGEAEDPGPDQRRLVEDMAELALAAEQGAAGSRRLFALFPWVEELMAAAVSALVASRERVVDPSPARMATAEEARRSLVMALDSVRERPPHRPEVRQIRRPRDWISAWMNGARAVVAVLIVAAAWQLTGWWGGPWMLLATCLFSLIFSTSDTPAASIGRALLGGTIAFIAAFTIRYVLFPGPQPPALLTAAVAPLTFIGGLVMANRSVAIVGTEFNMLLLLLVEPGVEMKIPGQLLETAAGLGAGFATVILANLTLFPMSPKLKLRESISALTRAVQGLALDPGERADAWIKGAHGRILRLANRAARARVDDQTVDRALSLLSAARAIRKVEASLGRGTLTSREEVLVRRVLGSFIWLRTWPERVAGITRKAVSGIESEPELASDLAMLAHSIEHGAPLVHVLRKRPRWPGGPLP